MKLNKNEYVVTAYALRASGHLITMLNTVQRLKLECDKLTAELRCLAASS